jgi:uncharacterized membrane protein YjgN (DUF898 family)
MENMTTGSAPARTRHDVRFEGSGGEYFKIWIVNLALTIVTLGIFSAWAKVRNKRYFYGNTFIAGHNFEYHGQPVRILIGRLIALGLLLVYSITASLAPFLAGLWAIALFFAVPWLAMASFRFNARNSSYRNIRFDFHGTYGGAFKAFIAWPFLAVITLFTTWPLAHRARYYYQINSHSFGGHQFNTEMPGGRMYVIFLQGIGVFAVATLVIFAAIAASAPALFASGGLPQEMPSFGIWHLLILLMIPIAFSVQAFISTMTLNLAVNGTRLGDAAALESRLSPLAMVWLLFSNLFLILITLGLFSPWAHVRMTRYLAAHIAVNGPQNTDQFVGSYARTDSAIGEEVAGFFDFDFSL